MSQVHLDLQQEFDFISVRYTKLRASLASRKHERVGWSTRLQNEGDEHEATRECYTKLVNELSLIKELVEFDSIAQLRSKIQNWWI
jgi:hypothetical protein